MKNLIYYIVLFLGLGLNAQTIISAPETNTTLTDSTEFILNQNKRAYSVRLDSLVNFIGDVPYYETDQIYLNNTITGSVYYTSASPNTSETLTVVTDSLKVGGAAVMYTNTSTEPTVNGATIFGNSTFVADETQLLYFYSHDGTTAKYFFANSDGGGGTPTLQEVTEEGATTNIPTLFQSIISVGDGSLGIISFGDGEGGSIYADGELNIVHPLGVFIGSSTEIQLNASDLLYNSNTVSSFAGNYNPTINTPTLSNLDTQKEGIEFYVNVAGTHDFGAGDITFGVGDILSNDGTVWYKKVDNNQGGGSTPTLQEVTGQGATTTDDVTFEGEVTVGDGSYSLINLDDGNGGVIESDGSSIAISNNTKDYTISKTKGLSQVTSFNVSGYNATTDTPTLANTDTGDTALEYKVTTAGTQDFGAGNITFGVGDIIANDGIIWYKKVDNNQSGGLNFGTRLTASISGATDLDWATDNTVFDYTLTANTTLSNDNLPTGTATKVIELYITGDFSLTLPATWTALPNNDTYDGTGNNHLVVTVINGTTSSEIILYSLTNI